MDLPIDEVDEAAALVKEVVDPNCNIIFGAGIDEALSNEVEITDIATGFSGKDGGKEPQRDLKDIMKTQEPKQEPADDKLKDYEARLNSTSTAKQEPEVVSNTSRIKVDDSNIPPFLRRLQNK